MLRGIMAVVDKDWRDDLKHSYETPLDMIYYVAAGLNNKEQNGIETTGWVGGCIETDMYFNGLYSKPFDEDNNNGWNIIKFIVDQKKCKVSAEIFCVVGEEDKEKAKDKNVKSYFGDKIDQVYVENLKRFKWNNKLKKEAADLLTALIEKGEKQREHVYYNGIK